MIKKISYIIYWICFVLGYRRSINKLFYSKTKNIGYVRSIVVTSALVMYLYSLFFMNAEFNMYTCLGIILVMLGIVLIVNFSGKN